MVCFWKEDRRIMERVNPHNPPNGQGMPHQSPLAPILLILKLSETGWGGWAGWGKPQQLKLLIWWGLPHLTPPRGSQRATGHRQFQMKISVGNGIHLELSMTRQTSENHPRSTFTAQIGWWSPDLVNVKKLAEIRACDWSRAQNAGFSLVERSLRKFLKG